jgi:hypothetical protein
MPIRAPPDVCNIVLPILGTVAHQPQGQDAIGSKRPGQKSVEPFGRDRGGITRVYCPTRFSAAAAMAAPLASRDVVVLSAAPATRQGGGLIGTRVHGR